MSYELVAKKIYRLGKNNFHPCLCALLKTVYLESEVKVKEVLNCFFYRMSEGRFSVFIFKTES
jgi:hypothetical protein